MLVLNPLHTHTYFHTWSNTRRDLSLLLSLCDGHSILNLKVLLEIRQLFFFPTFWLSLRDKSQAQRGCCAGCCTNWPSYQQQLGIILSTSSNSPRAPQQSLQNLGGAEPLSGIWKRAQTYRWYKIKGSLWRKPQPFLRQILGIHFIKESFFTFYTKKEYARCLSCFNEVDGYATSNDKYLLLAPSEGLIVELAGCSPQRSWACACARYHKRKAERRANVASRLTIGEPPGSLNSTLPSSTPRVQLKVSSCSKGVICCCSCFSAGYLGFSTILTQWSAHKYSLMLVWGMWWVMCTDKITVSPNGSSPSEQSQVSIYWWACVSVDTVWLQPSDGWRTAPPTPPGSHPTGQRQTHSLNQWADMMETARIQGQTHRLMMAISDRQRAA